MKLVHGYSWTQAHWFVFLNSHCFMRQIISAYLSISFGTLRRLLILSKEPALLCQLYSQLIYDYLILLFRTFSYRIISVMLSPAAPFSSGLPLNLFPRRLNPVFWFYSPCRINYRSSFMYLSYTLRLNARISTCISFGNSHDCFSLYASG
jgi:hypothetical protein